MTDDSEKQMADPMSDFTNVELPSCCRATLRDIAGIIHTGKWIQGMALAGAFAGILTESPPFALHHVHHMDWTALASSIAVVPSFIRRKCGDIAAEHSFMHPDGELNRFWVALHQHFSP